ncbi:hypothetical protein [uncultured Megasphaera sp.]|uniref:hypothetical protein n=1 Tax=uncultured Megasphaera sp. TaxID=165188 RepID=UPI0025E1A9F8|nr:hypothetical protein [uncultured Megasphaera sp.]
MKLVNLTPHTINVLDDDCRPVCDIPVSGLPIPRCSQGQLFAGNINGIIITKQIFGAVENLPEPKENTYYVVSRMVAEAMPERGDLLVPGPLVRNADGQPCGCRGLSVIDELDKKEQKFGNYTPDKTYIDDVTGNEINIFSFENGYGASVIRGPLTYGGADGLYELAVIYQGEITSTTEVTADVEGWLDKNAVAGLLEKIEALEG